MFGLSHGNMGLSKYEELKFKVTVKNLLISRLIVALNFFKIKLKPLKVSCLLILLVNIPCIALIVLETLELKKDPVDKIPLNSTVTPYTKIFV